MAVLASNLVAAIQFAARARTLYARIDPIIGGVGQIIARAATPVVRRRRCDARCAIARYPLGYGKLDAHRVEWREGAAPARWRPPGGSCRRTHRLQLYRGLGGRY